MRSSRGPLRIVPDATADARTGLLRSLPDLRCSCQDGHASGVIPLVLANAATRETCRSCGVRGRTEGRPPRIRPACRFRVATPVVPDGHRVRHPRCPKCGQPLAYRADGANAWHLHVDDARFRLRAVSSAHGVVSRGTERQGREDRDSPTRPSPRVGPSSGRRG